MNTETELVQALIDAWNSGTPLSAEAATRLAPSDSTSAYRVQRQVGEALKWFPTGRPHAWKIGAPNLHTTPTAAPIADAVIINSTPEIAAQLPLSSRHTLIGVEVELAIRLATDLPANTSPETARAAIAEVSAAIEICDVRAHDWATLPALLRLADQQMNRWLILGTGTSGTWADDYSTRTVQLEINGKPWPLENPGHPLQDPLYLLPWLCQHVSLEYPQGLKSGDIITTGTWTGLYEAQPGDRIRASFAGIGQVAVDIANN